MLYIVLVGIFLTPNGALVSDSVKGVFSSFEACEEFRMKADPKIPNLFSSMCVDMTKGLKSGV
jgi:hypothetical protein